MRAGDDTMATAKKSAASDATPKPSSRVRTKPETATTAHKAPKPAEESVISTPSPEPPPRRKDRTFLIAVSFLAAAAFFAVGYGVGHAVGDDSSAIVGNDQRPNFPGIPFDDSRPGGRNDRPGPGQCDGGGYLPAPGPGDCDEPMPPSLTDQAFLGIAGVTSPLHGVIVTEVQPGSGADAAGLVVDDRIVSVDGAPIVGIRHLSMVIASSHPGDTITIGVDRGGEDLTVTAVLGSHG
jgi:membrane-associated protease RseP (regulator of RpoE activity)